MLKYIGIIEISVKSKIINYLTINNGTNWIDNPNLFLNSIKHTKLLSIIDDEVKRSKEESIVNHLKNYGQMVRPPEWKILEIVSLGTLSKLIGNLKNQTLGFKEVINDYQLYNDKFLKSWLLSFTEVRNVCAHYNKLWNRNINMAPKLFSNNTPNWVDNVPSTQPIAKLYSVIICMNYMLKRILNNNRFSNELSSLVGTKPLYKSKMGFPENWEQEVFWSK